MNKRRILEQHLNAIEKKLQQERVRVNKHEHSIKDWGKRHELILTSMLIVPAIVMVLKTKKSAHILLKGSRRVGKLLMTVGIAQVKNNLLKVINKG